jgi:hypothetical protein
MAGRAIKVCFDLFDGGKIISPDGLEKADVYFKRSYDPAVVETLEPGERAKVKPFGLNFGCLGDADKDIARRTVIERRLREAVGTPLSRDEWKFRTKLIISAVSPPGLPGPVGRFLIPRESAFRAGSGTRRQETVLFQPRIYAPEGAARALNILDLNEQRVRLVRALRRHFGHRFVGGVPRNRFAEAYCPDCLTTFPDDQWHYIRMLRTCSVAVVTEGLHGSIPWKVPEYLAAGLCIVSDPLRYQLPAPLLSEEHLLLYSTEEACIDACDRLLSNPDHRRSMEAANFAYYDSNVFSEQLMARCIDAASALVDRG